MTTHEIIIRAVVLLVGIPAAFRVIRVSGWPGFRIGVRNLTATGLVLCWLFGEYVWRITGDNLPEGAYLLADLTVLAIIYAKPPAYDCLPYRGVAHQLACFWIERSWWDRIVISIFPVMWMIYAAPLGDQARWDALYVLVLAQFFAAGGEAFISWLDTRAANAGDELSRTLDIPSSGNEYRTWGWGNVGHAG